LDRIFAIELLPSYGELPLPLRGLHRKEFWWKDEKEGSAPRKFTPKYRAEKYVDGLADVAYLIAKRLRAMHPQATTQARNASSVAGKTVLLAEVTDDLRRVRRQVREYLWKSAHDNLVAMRVQQKRAERNFAAAKEVVRNLTFNLSASRDSEAKANIFEVHQYFWKATATLDRLPRRARTMPNYWLSRRSSWTSSPTDIGRPAATMKLRWRSPTKPTACCVAWSSASPSMRPGKPPCP
jgi:hypothetical protein